jgi:hypothetical protein
VANLSGTYNFAPTIGSLALAAFDRCGIRRTEVLPQHMESAYLETNLMQSDWGADGITWWTVELIQQPLTQGVATYSVPANVVTVLDLYINNGSSNRLITSFSRTDYASLSEPSETGFPTSYWFDRLLASTITLWPVPDNANTYTMGYYAYTQIQDSVIRQGGQPAIPYWWLDAFTAGLAYRLSRMYAPQLEDKRKVDYQEAYAKACKQIEAVPLFLQPGLQGYFRP